MYKFLNFLNSFVKNLIKCSNKLFLKFTNQYCVLGIKLIRLIFNINIFNYV